MTEEKQEKVKPHWEHEEWHCICTCHSYEHQVHFDWWNDGEEPELYMTIHLAPRSFWQRLKQGIAYIFGHRCRYGDFDEVILGAEYADAFKKIAEVLTAMKKDSAEEKLDNE